MRVVLLTILCAASVVARDPLAQRIRHADPSRYRSSPSVHGGAGQMAFGAMLNASNFQSNFLFLHRGVLPPKTGIGQHFHSTMEEMFVILNGEAQFTIDGRTSVIKGPAGAPCRMGHSHAIYNATDQPVEWMNVAVATIKGKYDNFDLGDTRVGVPLDPIPQFISMKLWRELLRAPAPLNEGKGAVQYRRALPPEVFFTPWAYVDHVLMPSGTSIGAHKHMGVEELYYVMDGEGAVRVDDETAPVKKGDAIVMAPGDVHSFENTGGAPLELMVIGAAMEKGKIDSVNVK
ncbi:MAG: cupin domain-containing protein [Acidobacteriia bacterium]|nr:cupin domain-containing protein [Terriglobia bacterium]